MEWDTRSNAELKSRRTNRTGEWLEKLNKIWFASEISTDSVEWEGRKPDWYGSRDGEMKRESWENMAYSRSFDG